MDNRKELKQAYRPITKTIETVETPDATKPTLTLEKVTLTHISVTGTPNCNFLLQGLYPTAFLLLLWLLVYGYWVLHVQSLTVYYSALPLLMNSGLLLLMQVQLLRHCHCSVLVLGLMNFRLAAANASTATGTCFWINAKTCCWCYFLLG
ncbi:hypothetical protein OWV82_010461 [Melia azedarach]|uniref:Uncharacterized protein n=1 Tax=Melia azedarach TaxID=155640 RepID=A0ACC1Y5U8_MELAZ|nr:hypothetical protein OWV82_010461 [Melia azedarach]